MLTICPGSTSLIVIRSIPFQLVFSSNTLGKWHCCFVFKGEDGMQSGMIPSPWSTSLPLSWCLGTHRANRTHQLFFVEREHCEMELWWTFFCSSYVLPCITQYYNDEKNKKKCKSWLWRAIYFPHISLGNRKSTYIWENQFTYEAHLKRRSSHNPLLYE